MKGDVIILEKHHKQAAQKIIFEIIEKIVQKPTIYIITVAGESGSGKSETGQAIVDELERNNLKSVLFGQDDYFVLPPKSNDAKRRENAEWLGPHIEVKLDRMEQNIKDAIAGKNEILKPTIDYNKNSISEERISLVDVKVIVVEGTYTSLLKNVDTKIFISKNRRETLEHRKKRNRGNEVDDSFIEQILKMEHKIIAGHKFLADFIISKDDEIIIVK